MEVMDHNELLMCIDDLLELLQNPKIVADGNRQGLRRATGDLLEESFLDLVAELTPDISVEIGAHEASYSIRVKDRLPSVNAFAFEANPYVFAKHKDLPAITESAVNYRHLAICEQNQTVTLYVPRKWPKGEFSQSNPISSILPRNSDVFEYEVVEVEGLTLDHAMSDIPYSNAVAWIDVEGAQEHVLAGSPQFLERASAIYIELDEEEFWTGQASASAVARTLAEHGYLLVMRDNLARAQFNAVFVKDNSDVLASTYSVLEQYRDAVRNLIQ